MKDEWQDVINLLELSRVNSELAVKYLDDTIAELQKIQEKLTKGKEGLDEIKEQT